VLNVLPVSGSKVCECSFLCNQKFIANRSAFFMQLVTPNFIMNTVYKLRSQILLTSFPLKAVVSHLMISFNLVTKFLTSWCHCSYIFVCTDLSSSSHFVRFVDGLPCITTSSLLFACHQGRQTKKPKKEKQVCLYIESITYRIFQTVHL